MGLIVMMFISDSCSHPAGIVFLIDSSQSITPYFDNVISFIGTLLSG